MNRAKAEKGRREQAERIAANEAKEAARVAMNERREKVGELLDQAKELAGKETFFLTDWLDDNALDGYGPTRKLAEERDTLQAFKDGAECLDFTGDGAGWTQAANPVDFLAGLNLSEQMKAEEFFRGLIAARKGF
jgi:hypothetical protein